MHFLMITSRKKPKLCTWLNCVGAPQNIKYVCCVYLNSQSVILFKNVPKLGNLSTNVWHSQLYSSLCKYVVGIQVKMWTCSEILEALFVGKKMNADNNTENIILWFNVLNWRFKVALFGKMEDFFHFEPTRTLNN